MRTTALTALIVAALATAGSSAEKARKPHLDLRAAPRMAFSPVNVLLTAELNGGDDVDQYYCPALEWDWDDGGKSVHEADCPPMESGAALERRFTAEHAFTQAGNYTVKMTMRKANRAIAVATTLITVRAGGGDRNGMVDPN
jgi:PKD domain